MFGVGGVWAGGGVTLYKDTKHECHIQMYGVSVKDKVSVKYKVGLDLTFW